MSLRKEIIKLAHANPELREHLLPLIQGKQVADKQAADKYPTQYDAELGAQFGAFVWDTVQGGFSPLGEKFLKDLKKLSQDYAKKVFSDKSPWVLGRRGQAEWDKNKAMQLGL